MNQIIRKTSLAHVISFPGKFFCTPVSYRRRKGGGMTGGMKSLTHNNTKQIIIDISIPPVVREYDIGDTKYIVKATVKAEASEDAMTKVRRLIRNEMNRAK